MVVFDVLDHINTNDGIYSIVGLICYAPISDNLVNQSGVPIDAAYTGSGTVQYLQPFAQPTAHIQYFMSQAEGGGKLVPTTLGTGAVRSHVMVAGLAEICILYFWLV
jgi:hypothetical protein